LAYWGIAGLAIVTAIGTYERSALIGLVVLGVYMWVRTKHKTGFGIVLAIAACVVIYTSSSAWNSRVSTIGDYRSDSSALVRLLVWKWTLGFTATHPAGGGFMTYIVDRVDVPAAGAEPGHMEFGRAFHSIYFEVLGEHGYPGVVMFLLLAGSTFLALRRIAKTARLYPELQWVVGLSDALRSGLAVFLACGAFVGIAFQPMFWYFIAMSICLNAYMWRVVRQDVVPETGWRALALKPAGAPAAKPNALDWRKRAARPTTDSVPTGRSN
jgi:probable O-glycosylation ligase (exosortase A-associated)